MKNGFLLPLLVTVAVGILAFSEEEASSTPLEIGFSDAELPAEYPKGYFMLPTGGGVKLTGTFGELRPDHFHSGLDIKSNNGRVGQSVYAAAAGFVDRIKIQASGYGNILYIRHPNGYTTAYAHLDRFSSEIEDYVKKEQYKRESFEIDLRPKDGLFKVKKGEEIGKMGNSGSSSGPHLHFEIRHTATGKALNPELFDLGIPDNIAPELRDMRVYYLTENREVMHSKSISLKKDKKGKIGLQGDTLRIGAWRIGFGVKAYDQMSGFRNDNGIYGISLYADDKLVYHWKMDALAFEETRYMNAHIDYPAMRKSGAWFHRCFTLPGNFLDNYAKTESMGAIPISATVPVKITLKVADARQNKTTLSFYVLRDEENMEIPNGPEYQFVIPYNQAHQVQTEYINLNFPKGLLYESCRFSFNTSVDESYGVYSPVYHLHDGKTPAHRLFEVGLRAFNVPEALKSKAVVSYCGSGRPDNCGGEWRGDKLFTKVRRFGDYCVMIDKEAPQIQSITFASDMRKHSEMAFRIRDNFDVAGIASDMRYRGEVDGRWILFEYDKKRSRLSHTFDGRIGPGKHFLRLVVTDDRGNEGVFESEFER